MPTKCILVDSAYNTNLFNKCQYYKFVVILSFIKYQTLDIEFPVMLLVLYSRYKSYIL